MPGDASPWDPNAWEKHIQRVLKLRYSQRVGTYQHIPAEIGGDYGLEGFAADGTAYQCYACQTWTDSAFLLKKQKTKMTADIGKLIKNEANLLKILGDIRIGIWNFVLPFWNDKELLMHANKKTEEVLAPMLFAVLIERTDGFSYSVCGILLFSCGFRLINGVSGFCDGIGKPQSFGARGLFVQHRRISL